MKCPACDGSGVRPPPPIKVHVEASALETAGGRLLHLTRNQAVFLHTLLHAWPATAKYDDIFRDLYGPIKRPKLPRHNAYVMARDINLLFQKQYVKARVQAVYRVGYTLVFEH